MFEREYVLLGLGDREANSAIDWAAREAHARNADLRIVRAIHPRLTPWDSIADTTVTARYRESVEHRLREAMARAHERCPDVVLHCEVVDAAPADALLERSRQAIVVVLGAIRLGSAGAAALGTVSAIVTAQAPVPVVVARGPHGRPAEDRAVIVGVDGSAATDDVLSFAFDQANQRGLPLHPVFCWPADSLADQRARPAPRPSEPAEHWLTDVLARWIDKFPQVEVQWSILRRRPVVGLVAASSGQELLVVGGRATDSTALGPVSQGVLHHARCSVAIVH